MSKRGLILVLILVSMSIPSMVFAANNQTITSHVFVLNVNPIVVQVVQSNNPAECGVDYLIIKANVTDNNGVPNDIASVNATFDFGTPLNQADDVTVWLTYNSTSGLYENNTYALPSTATLGTWNVIVYALDNFGGVGYNSTSFTVQDTIYPSVTSLEPTAGAYYNSTSVVKISATITDYCQLQNTRANVSWDSAYESLTLNYNTTSGKYEAYFINTTYIGTYNVTFFANDNANNINNTEWTYFYVVDATPPVIWSVNATPNTVDPGNMINFTANVTDPIGTIDTVILEINYATNYTMYYDPSTGLYYNQSVDTFLPPGTYNFTVYANDTAGNNATPMTGNFTINTLVSITLSNYPIDFGNTTVPVTDRRADNGTAGSGYVGGTVKGFPLIVNNTGNVNENLSIRGTDLVGQVDPSYVIGISNMTYNLTATLPGTPLTTSDVVFRSNLASYQIQELYFWISLPSGLISQDYNGNVTITAVQS